MKLMNSNSQVVQVMGAPVTPGIFIMGSLSSSGNYERYNYNFPVYGPRRSATVNVRGTSDPSGLHMDVWLSYKSGTEDVTLHLTQGK